jgi:hypothetical protein
MVDTVMQKQRDPGGYMHEENMWRKNRSRRPYISVQKLPVERGGGWAE